MPRRKIKPTRRVDAREPLETLSLLNLSKKGDRPLFATDKTDKDDKSPRPERWM